MKIYQILLLLFFITSCKEKKQKQISNIDTQKIALKLKIEDIKLLRKKQKFDRIDSLSEYKLSAMKYYIDSLKLNDTIKYFALRKAMERDSINFYDDNFLKFWGNENVKSDKEYLEIAKKQILEND